MALTQQQLAEINAWVNTYAAQTNELSQRTAAQVAALYAGQNFWSTSSASAVAAQAADTSNAADLVAAGLASQYLAMTLGATLGGPVPVPNLPAIPVRNGVSLAAVFERPMKLFRRKVSEGMEPAAAYDMAMRLAGALVDGNIRLAKRDQITQILRQLPRELGVTGYRRVVHPELAKSGHSCGLCIVASDVVYSVGTLMPLHANCNCEPVPIVKGLDPGNSLDNLALGDLYQAAAGDRNVSGTAAADLKRVRVAINEHGEWGPVLTYAGQHFLGPDDLAPAA